MFFCTNNSLHLDSKTQNETIQRIEKVLQEVAQQGRQRTSFSNTQTRAKVVQSMLSSRDYIFSKELDDWLEKMQCRWWPVGGSKDFPKLLQSEKMHCQPFVSQMLQLFVKGEVYVNYSDKRARRRKVTVNSVPEPDAYTHPTVGTKYPDCVMYDGIKRGTSAVTILGEVKGRSGDGDFAPEEIGQLLDVMEKLMDKYQPFRPSMIGFLTDGYRFVFVRRTRYMEGFRFTHSSIYTKEAGWKVRNHDAMVITTMSLQIL